MTGHRALIVIVVLIFLASATHRVAAADGPEDWDSLKYRLYRGNMHVHTWISSPAEYQAGTADKIDTTISLLNGRLDFAGISDISDEMSNRQWLANRGACSSHIVRDMLNLTIQPVPGFEWEYGAAAPAPNADLFRISIFGEDRLLTTADNTNAHHGNVANGETINIAHPVVDNSAYVNLGMNFFEHRYDRYQDFPGSAVISAVDSLYSWMNNNNNDPYGLTVGQFNARGADDATLQRRIDYLDRNRLTSKEGLQRRMCLMEVSSGDAAYRGIGEMRHYYNLALCNHWKVAPSHGIDNAGTLANNPAVAQRFLGLWIDENDSRMSDPNVRAKRILMALRERRTFVSENPYVTLKFSSALCDQNNNPLGGTERKMGDDSFMNSIYGSSSGPHAEVRFTLTMAMENNAPQDDTRYRVRNDDIKLVRIGEFSRDTVASGATPIIVSGDVTKYFTTTTVFKPYDTDNFEGTSTADLVNRTLQDSGNDPGREFTITRNPRPDPTIFDLRDGILTLTCDDNLRPFDYIHNDKDADARIICFYAMVRFLSGEYAVSSPLWVVSKESF